MLSINTLSKKISFFGLCNFVLSHVSSLAYKDFIGISYFT